MRRHGRDFRADRQSALTFFGFDHFCDAEIGELHLSLLSSKMLLRLDVAVDDASVVRVLKRVAYRRHHGQRLCRREASRPEAIRSRFTPSTNSIR